MASRHTVVRRPAGVLFALCVACVLVVNTQAAQQGPPNGVSPACTDHLSASNLVLTVLFPIIGLAGLITDFFADEGWVWVEPDGRRTRDVSGEVVSLGIAVTDTFANHDSHDIAFNVKVDPGQEDRLSPVSGDHNGDGEPDSIHIEWETGIDPGEKTGDGANRMFPKWVWPSEGDRAWVDGHWVYDCGHTEEDGGDDLYYTEIHPARAVASMREQAAPLPGTGDTPVPVTKTDLYIHGRGGFVVEQLECGMNIVFNPLADCSVKTSQIAADFAFDVCLPRRFDNAVFSTRIEAGPDNTVDIAPDLDLVPAAGGCLNNLRFDQTYMMRVSVPLGNSGTPPEAIYARHIFAGWVTAPEPALERRAVTLTSMDLYDDHDVFSGELTFSWMNLDRAPSPWIRFSDFTSGMNDFDDDNSKSFSGAGFDFYLRNEEVYTVRSTAMEQDCLDGFYGFHFYTPAVYLACYFDLFEFASNDEVAPVTPTAFDKDALGTQFADGDDFKLWLDVSAVPLTTEDTADLSVGIACTPSGEVALLGEPLPCATEVGRGGPGLPRRATLDETFGGGATATINSATWPVVVPEPPETLTRSCALIATNTAKCDLKTHPVGDTTTVTATITPTSPGLLRGDATVSTESTDPVSSNNTASTTVDVFLPISIDVSPRSDDNILNLGRGGTVEVAILTTPDFNAATADVATICFGDADAPGERLCVERHGRGHFQDVDHDRDEDLLLHYSVDETGIDVGDVRACLKGRTTAGIGIYGCQAIVAVNPPKP